MTMPTDHPAREDVEFLSHGTRCSAWLYRPTSGEARPPLVVMGHGLGGTRDLRLAAYAERFAAAGFAALVFDYRYSGSSDGEPRQLVDVRRQLEDWHAVLAFARTLEIDRDRIAIWGTSFGGGHVMRIGAEDQAVAAVVAQCPFTDGPASFLARARHGFLSSGLLLFLAVVDAIGAKLGRRKALAVGMTGSSWMPAFMVAKDCVPGTSGLVQPGSVMSARTSRLLARFPKLAAKFSPNLRLDDGRRSGRRAPSDGSATTYAGVGEGSTGQDPLWGVVTQPDGSRLHNALAARLVLTLPFYRPGRDLKRLGTTPALVCACDLDTVAPPGPTVRYASDLANVRLIRYPYSHFGIYVDDAFEQAVGDQIAFLQEKLQPTG
ncbi:MAG: alpha/beta fold hydrolase [Solirubrobacteraceae bacterium]|nr:alpha/beta fold hydrolase [Solirubrobacteraceae bacterium]